MVERIQFQNLNTLKLNVENRKTIQIDIKTDIFDQNFIKKIDPLWENDRIIDIYKGGGPCILLKTLIEIGYLYLTSVIKIVN